MNALYQRLRAVFQAARAQADRPRTSATSSPSAAPTRRKRTTIAGYLALGVGLMLSGGAYAANPCVTYAQFSAGGSVACPNPPNASPTSYAAACQDSGGTFVSKAAFYCVSTNSRETVSNRANSANWKNTGNARSLSAAVPATAPPMPAGC